MIRFAVGCTELHWVALSCTDFRQPLAHLWNDLRQPLAHLWRDLGQGIDFLSFLTPKMSQNHTKFLSTSIAETFPEKASNFTPPKAWKYHGNHKRTYREIYVGIYKIHQTSILFENVECVKTFVFFM